MKKYCIVFCLLCFSILSFSQEEYQSVFNSGSVKSTKPVFYALLSVEHQAVISNTKPGIEFGLINNSCFFSGLYAQGTSGNFSLPDVNGEILHSMYWESGLSFSYVDVQNQIFHWGGGCKVAYVGLYADAENEMKLFEDYSQGHLSSDRGFVLHPEFFGELNLSSYTRVRLGIGYSFYSLSDEDIFCSRSLNSWTLNMAFLFSHFYNLKSN